MIYFMTCFVDDVHHIILFAPAIPALLVLQQAMIKYLQNLYWRSLVLETPGGQEPTYCRQHYRLPPGSLYNRIKLKSKIKSFPPNKSLNSLPPGRYGSNFKIMLFKLIILALALSVKLLENECHRILLMRSHHWFKSWLGAIRQQAIIWTNVDPELCCHMASLGHRVNKLRPH